MSRARLVLRIAFGLLLCATAACSLTVGFDGFVGPPDESDGGEDDLRSRDLDEPDTGEGPRVDGGGAPEADGATDAEAGDPNAPPQFLPDGSTSFCNTPQGPSAFCEDFDTADLTARWLREGVFGKLTSYAPKSPPNVFLLNVPPTTATGTFVSKISHSFDFPSRSVILGFDFKPELVNTGSSFFMLAALEWPSGEEKYSLRLVYSSGDIRLEESNLVPPPNNVDSYHPFFNVPEDKWSRITLDAVASGATPGAQISIDGLPIGGREALTPTADVDEHPRLILGAVYAANPHTGWTLRYDNVTVNLR
jgi:hypothetical protein